MVESQRLYERIGQQIASEIDSGTYVVGQRLPSERDLAQKFCVSRTTIREAMIALELDGLVEVRTGSGVYVTHKSPPDGSHESHDVGPFELLEARRAIEGEACAMAALRISDEQVAQLSQLVNEMRNENKRSVESSEDADRRFHELIAAATENSCIITAVQMLWAARVRSPQNRSMSAKVRALGIKPRIDEHVAIVNALKRRDAAAARAAMRDHLTRVLEATFEATETEELEKARAQIDAKRKRFVSA